MSAQEYLCFIFFMWSVRVSFSLNDSRRLFLLRSSLPSEGRWRLTTEDDAPGPHGGDWEIDDSDHPSEQGPSIDDSYHPDFGRDQNGFS